jgi:hypothetical protein
MRGAMSALWRGAVRLVSFALALLLVLWLRSVGYGWFSALSLATLLWVILTYTVLQIRAAMVMVAIRQRIRRIDPSLADKIVNATEGLAPTQQEAIAKRIIDDVFKR